MKISKMLETNFSAIEKNIQIAQLPITEFTAGIPAVSKMVGIKSLTNQLNLTAPQYYRRLNGEIPWTISELKKIQDILKKSI